MPRKEYYNHRVRCLPFRVHLAQTLTVCVVRSGWPSRGAANGRAVASVDDAKNALLNLNCACRDDRGVPVYAFEGDDQNWKGDDRERSFGILFNKYNLLGEVFAPC